MKKTKEQNTKYQTLNTNHGITIISLIITIIVMIILASVTITVVVNTGLFEHAKNAKDSLKNAEEREIIQKAAIYALEEGKIDKENLLEKLKNKLGEGNIETYNKGDGSVIVKIIDKNIAYEVDKKGNLKEVSMDIFNADSTPGVLDGKGTTSDPYIIMSIEDLMYISRASSATNAGWYMQNRYVELGRDLDFQSELSYCDYKTKEYNEFLGITDDVGLMGALTNEKYNGFKPITKFCGTFNGNNKTIKNLYINGEDNYLGLIAQGISTTKIMNLEITGQIISTGNNVGGISAQYGNFENCTSRVDITSAGNKVGGIVGENGVVTNCKNYGQIIGVNYVGGISGYGNDAYDCKNYGNVRATSYCGRYYGIRSE